MHDYGTTRGARKQAPPLDFAEIKQRVQGHWPSILRVIGLPEQFLSNKNGPCFACNGRDRYRFIDRNGDGWYICNQCGSGDGFSLVQKFLRVSTTEAFRTVDKALGGVAIERQHVTPATVGEGKDLSGLIEQTWRETRGVLAGDPVHAYLTKTRGLAVDSIPPAIR